MQPASECLSPALLCPDMGRHLGKSADEMVCCHPEVTSLPLPITCLVLGGSLVEKAAFPKPCSRVPPGTRAEASLSVHWRSGPPLLLRKDRPKSGLWRENGVTWPGIRAHGGPWTHGSEADSPCEQRSLARPLGCGSGGALPPATGGRGPGRRREDGALLPPGVRGRAALQRCRGREPGGGGSPATFRAGPPAPREVTGRGAGMEEGKVPLPSLLVVCPCPSHQAATFLLSAVLCCHTAHSPHVRIEF